MSDIRNYQRVVNSRSGFDSTIDEGLRAYMIKVYNLMAFGLIITGVTSFLVSSLATTSDVYSASLVVRNGVVLTEFGKLIYTSPLSWIIMFSPFAVVIFMSVRLHSLSTSKARMLFFLYSVLIGLSLSAIFLVYTNKSILQTFFITAASFGSLSLYGYTTNRDLNPIGSFFLMGLAGIILVSLVNIFVRSSAVELALSTMGILIFAGLTAYDTQKIKESYSGNYGSSYMDRQSIMGALMLYMDFINIFMYLLRFVGNRRD
ncbi:Bax inhibitor-1/YccA family protein [Candidatus Liberibacter brunswickensis]|uniref:Bax inhibitor-1/YccA family protein n=1 Tax=Candidatus Liberibacter brunswickensis TaxID=1968796 RepID=UPI002FE32D03